MHIQVLDFEAERWPEFVPLESSREYVRRQGGLIFSVTTTGDLQARRLRPLINLPFLLGNEMPAGVRLYCLGLTTSGRSHGNAAVYRVVYHIVPESAPLLPVVWQFFSLVANKLGQLLVDPSIWHGRKLCGKTNLLSGTPREVAERVGVRCLCCGAKVVVQDVQDDDSKVAEAYRLVCPFCPIAS